MSTRPRIVSLVPSATEIVCLLGAGDRLVGRSHECDYPESIRAVPALTRAKTSGDSPAQIDRQVRDHLAAGASLYHLDLDHLRALRPDIIITQDLCRVCSIDLATVRRAADSLSPRPSIVSLNPRTIDEVLDDVLKVGAALDLEHRAAEEVVRLRERLAAAADFVNPYEDGPSVAFLEWTDPLFAAGHWTVQLVERAGGRHPLNPTGAEHAPGDSRCISGEDLTASRPEYVVVCPCGMNLEQTRAAAAALARQRWFRDLPAALAGNVALVDGNQMFNRPGPRLVEAFQWLVGWLQGRPELIPAGFPWCTQTGEPFAA